jgi:nitrogen fixation protein NifU and related proteins
MDSSSLYQELILDHWRHPHHFGELANATHRASGVNPICGDDVIVYLIVKNNIIQNIQFLGQGCAISIASASLMTEALIGKSYSESLLIFNQFHQMLTNHTAPLMTTNRLEVLANVKNFPMRTKCATLPWHAFKAALENLPQPISTEVKNDGQ